MAEARTEDGSVVQEIGGGISGTVGGRRVVLGNWKWVAQHLHDTPSQPPDLGPSTLKAEGGTGAQQRLQVGKPIVVTTFALGSHRDTITCLKVMSVVVGCPNQPYDQGLCAYQVFVAVDREVAGVLSLSDTVRPEAAATIAALQQQGFQTYLLTGRPTNRFAFSQTLRKHAHICFDAS